MRKILYVGWIGFNNLGDELMWRVFEQLSRKHLDVQQFQVIPSLPGVDLVDLSPYDTIVLGGGSLLVPGYVDVAHRAARVVFRCAWTIDLSIFAESRRRKQSNDERRSRHAATPTTS